MFYKCEELNKIAEVGNKNVKIMQEKTDLLFENFEKVYRMIFIRDIAFLITTISVIIHTIIK